MLALSWTDYSVDEDGFAVERRNARGGPFVQIAVVGRNQVAYLDQNMVAGTYCYRVRAFNAVGSSAYTAEKCGTTVPSGPPVSVVLDKASYRHSETMVATVRARPELATPADVYVVLQAGGAVLSLQLNGRLVPGLVPLVRNVVLPAIDAPFSFPLAGAPPGTYTWLAAATAVGTQAVIAPIASATFTISP